MAGSDLYLIVPDLRSLGLGSAEFPRMPALETLLVRGESTHHKPLSSDEAWFSAFGIVSEGGRDLPAAAVAASGDGLEPGDACLMFAHPVYLQPDRDRLILFDSSGLSIDLDEANEILAQLNQTYAADGWRFRAAGPDRWYVYLDSIPAMTTVPLAEATGRSVDPNLPVGKQAKDWHRTLNEIQMLLHAHPVNAAREARNEQPINSVWFAGAGVAPRLEPEPGLSVVTDDPVGLGLARLATGVQHPGCLTLPGSGYAEHEGRSVVAILPYNSAQWPAPVSGQTLEHDWFAPLLGAIRSGHIRSAVVSIIGIGEFEIDRRALRRWWRRRRSINDWI